MNQFRMLITSENTTVYQKSIYRDNLVILDTKATNYYSQIKMPPIGKRYDDKCSYDKVYYEIKEFRFMFKSIDVTLKLMHEKDKENLEMNKLTFWGYPESSTHYELYRFMKEGLKANEEPWRYRSRDALALEKYRAMKKVVESSIDMKSPSAGTNFDPMLIFEMIDAIDKVEETSKENNFNSLLL